MSAQSSDLLAALAMHVAYLRQGGFDGAWADMADVMEQAAARIETVQADQHRLDFLEQHNTEVRIALVHGSRHLFFATVNDSVEGETGPSDIRAKIDAAALARPVDE